MTPRSLPNGGRWRFIRLVAVIAACVIGVVPIVKFVHDRSDPGPDERLNGKTFDQLAAELGEPPSDPEAISCADISDADARRKYLDLNSSAQPDRAEHILVATWSRSGDDLPTKLETTVWFQWVGDNWVAFHNYRRYCWAGL